MDESGSGGVGGERGTIRIGIGGWIYEPWRQTFYPKGLPKPRELAHAASRLGTIEINSTFYGSQKPETFAKWRDETPDGFVFAVKAPRFSTHRRSLADAGESIARFIDGVVTLGDKLGPINWQLAPTKRFDHTEIEAFLALLPKQHQGRPLRHAIEVRHESFRDPSFIALARRHEVAIVLAADSEYPQIADPTAPFVYVRLMGTQEHEPLGYPAAALDDWAVRLRTLAAGAPVTELTPLDTTPPRPVPRDVFAYVISGFKATNPLAARALIERLTPAAQRPERA